MSLASHIGTNVETPTDIEREYFYNTYYGSHT